MGKAKTSRKRKAFSVDDMEPAELKKGVKTTPHDPIAHLADPDFIFNALIDCLATNDMKAFKQILKAHYEALNIAGILKKTGLKKRTFYGALSDKGNPTLSTVFMLIAGLKSAG